MHAHCCQKHEHAITKTKYDILALREHIGAIHGIHDRYVKDTQKEINLLKTEFSTFNSKVEKQTKIAKISPVALATTVGIFVLARIFRW